jgi:hypothetical protein
MPIETPMPTSADAVPDNPAPTAIAAEIRIFFMVFSLLGRCQVR